jgi:hypothetical protein
MTSGLVITSLRLPPSEENSGTLPGSEQTGQTQPLQRRPGSARWTRHPRRKDYESEPRIAADPRPAQVWTLRSDKRSPNTFLPADRIGKFAPHWLLICLRLAHQVQHGKDRRYEPQH